MAIAIYVFTTVVFLGISALAAFLAYRRGFFKSAVKLGITVLCLVLAAVISMVLSSVVTDLTTGLLDSVLERSGDLKNTVYDLFEASPTLEALITALPAVVVCPLLFVLIFFILKLILDVIFKIVSACVIKKRELVVFNGSKYVPIAFGVLITFICFFVMTLPLNGVITIATDIYEASADYIIEDGPTKDFVDGVVDGLDKNPVKTVTYALGQEALLNELTSFEHDGVSYSLGEELTNLTKTATTVIQLAESDINCWGENEAAIFEELAVNVCSSELFTSVSAELLKGASDKWSEGEPFAGIDLPESEMLEPLMDTVLNSFGSATPQTVKEDIETLGKTASIFVRNGATSLLTSGSDTQQILETVSTPGMLSEVFGVLYENERLAPIVPELTEFGMKTAADALGVPDKKEQKENLYIEIATKLNKASSIVDDDQRANAYIKAVKDVFKKNGINADVEAQQVLAADLSAAFNGRNDVSADDVKNYFDGLDMISADEGESSRDSLVSKYGQEKVDNVFGSDSEAAEKEISERNAALDLLDNCSDADKSTVLSIAPSKDLATDKPTVESLVDGINFENASKEDVMELGDLLSSLVGSVGNVMDGMNSLDSNASATDKLKNLDAKELGSAFDAVNGNLIIGNSAMDLLDQGIKSTTGMDIGIRDIVDNSEEGVDNSSYEDVLGNLQHTVDVMDTIKDTSISHEEKVEKVDEFMDNLDTASATSISKLINEDIAISMGVPENKAATSTTFIKNVFVELGKTEDKDGKEAEAVKYLFDVAMSAKDGGSELFGEGGRIENADTFVNKVLDSRVALNTIKSSSTDENGAFIEDPLGVSGKMSENDREDLVTALDKIAVDPATTADQLEALDDIANMFGVEWAVK